MSFFGRLVISFELTDQTSQWQLFDATIVLPKSQSRNHLNHFFQNPSELPIFPCRYLHPPEVEQRVYPWIWQVGLEDDRFAFLLGFGNKLSGPTVGCSTSGFGVPEFLSILRFRGEIPSLRDHSPVSGGSTECGAAHSRDGVHRGKWTSRAEGFFSASPCHWKSGKPCWVL